MSEKAAKPEMSAIFMDFARYFELSAALTQQQRDDVFSVRYSVYCEEFGYEDAASFTDRMERDTFDKQSVHCLVRHKSSGMPAGCVRLVTPDEGIRMPLEDHCEDAIDQEFFADFADLRASMGEISRLAIDGQFRRRRGETESRFGNTSSLHFEPSEKRTFPLIAVALFFAAASVAQLLRRQHCFAIMEPFLPVLLRRSGVVVKRVGEDFNHRGVRAPYYLNVDDAAVALPEELRLYYEAVRGQFADVLKRPVKQGAM